MIDYIDIPSNSSSFINKICELNPHLLQYNSSNTNVFTITNETLIILRNPIDRFCVSVNKTMEKNNENTEILRKNNINTPEKWCNVLCNITDIHYPIIMSEIKKTHFIDNVKMSLNPYFSLQKLWINNPTYVILYENLYEEFKLFMIAKQLYGNIEYIHLNDYIFNDLSPKSIHLLQNIYINDFKIYEYYKSLHFIQRYGYETMLKMSQKSPNSIEQ